jgi:hypothetical protein
MQRKICESSLKFKGMSIGAMDGTEPNGRAPEDPSGAILPSESDGPRGLNHIEPDQEAHHADLENAISHDTKRDEVVSVTTSPNPKHWADQEKGPAQRRDGASVRPDFDLPIDLERRSGQRSLSIQLWHLPSEWYRNSD